MSKTIYFVSNDERNIANQPNQGADNSSAKPTPSESAAYAQPVPPAVDPEPVPSESAPVDPSGTPPQPPRRSVARRIARIFGFTILSLLALVVILIALLYIPAVQDFVIPKMLDKINSGSETEIRVDKFRLTFPLDVSFEGLQIFQQGDTMLIAQKGSASVEFMPLLSGNLTVNNIGLNDFYYKSGTPDSVTYIRAKANVAAIDRANIALANTDITASNIDLTTGFVKIALRTDTLPPTPPSDNAMVIAAQRIALNDMTFELTMDTSIDTIVANFGSLAVVAPRLDMGARRINIEKVDLANVKGALVIPEVPVEVPVDTTWTPPWGIAIANLSLNQGDFTYRIAGSKPQPGLDFNFMQFADLNIDVDSFNMLGSSLTIPIKRLHTVERSGLDLSLNGRLELDSIALRLSNARLSTPATALQINATYGMLADVEYEPLAARIAGDLAPSDIALFMPAVAPIVNTFPNDRDINVAVDIEGTLNNLNIDQLSLALADYWDIALKGSISDYDSMDTAVGNLEIAGNITDIDFLKPALLDPAMQREINLPPLSLNGNVDLNHGVVDGSLKALTQKGSLALDAYWNNRNEGYDIDFDADRFPVGSFMPGLGVGHVTASAKITGAGLDPFKKSTHIDGSIDITEAEYNGNTIHDVTLDGSLADGFANLLLNSANRALDLNLGAEGNLNGDTYNWTLNGDIRNLDLYALGLTDSIASVAMRFDANVGFTPAGEAIDARISIPNFNAEYGADHLHGNELNLLLAANDSLTSAHAESNNLALNFTSPMKFSDISVALDSAFTALDYQAAHHNLDIIELHQKLPTFALDARLGPDNFLADYLAASGTRFRNISLNAANDSIISFTAAIDSIVVNDTRIDRIDINAYQRDQYLRYRVAMNNQPGTLDEFAFVQANGYIAENKLSVFITQRDIEGNTGYNIGAMATLDPSDDIVTLRFVPYKPTIAYKPWTVNRDNYILVNLSEKRLLANLLMQNAESMLHLYSVTDSIPETGTVKDNLFLDIDKIHIQDWIALNPYMPPMKGDLSANLQLSARKGIFNGAGTVSLSDFTYNKKRVGTFDLDLDLTTSRAGTVHATAALDINKRRAMTIAGNLNDSTAVNPFLLDFNMIRFPLEIANPFVAGTASLSGYLNGEMDITGSLEAPRFNGFVAFDSAAVNIDMIGSKLKFTDEKIPVDANIIQFNNYKILGVNNNALATNGTIDFRHASNVAIDLDFKADNMQVVGAEKSRRSDVYGKAFVSLDAKARGNLSFINVNANLTVNKATNVSYIIPDATAALASRSNSDLVKFVNFNDSIAMLDADTIAPPSGLMNFNVLLTVQPGAVIGVDLSSNGQNRVQMTPSGTLDYTLDPMGNSRLTGRLNIDGGFVRYTPPLMSEKFFNFVSGSYVNFSGNMMDPRLNLKLVDNLQANVTQEGQNSRLIYFDVSLNVSGTLNNMDIKFDLSTDDDITVQNELLSMSPDQRANQAINMLLYNTYIGPNTRGNSNLGGNALYSFVESTVNSWMANNIKGVDISFGIGQYNRIVDGASTNTMNYSYKVSKSLFDDRVKIVVGGNYSTDADPDQNVSENLINDISVEYYINKSGTMYIRLFRHTGYESILEGEVTQTGVGFVYKRKMRKFRYLFNFLYPKKHSEGVFVPSDETSPVTVITESSADPESDPDAQPQQTNINPIILNNSADDETDL